MTYATWEPRHRLTTIRPGKWDLFVVTLIDGKQVGLAPVTDYDAELEKAQAFHRNHKCQVKVLPLTGVEFRNLFGLTLPDRPKPIDAEVVQEITETLKRVARDSDDPDARTDAMQLLAEMGEITV